MSLRAESREPVTIQTAFGVKKGCPGGLWEDGAKRAASAFVERLSKGVSGIEVEKRLHPCCHVIRHVDKDAAAGYGKQDHAGAFLHRKLYHLDRVMDQFDRPAEIEAADDRKAAFERSAEQC